MTPNQLELYTLKCFLVSNFVISSHLEQLGQNRAVNLLTNIAFNFYKDYDLVETTGHDFKSKDKSFSVQGF